MKIRFALACALGVASANALACYTVYDRNDRVVYNDTRPPMDMSLPLHQTLPQRFPGGHMVFDDSRSCSLPVQAGRVLPAGSSAPLLTNAATAQALRLTHTTMASNITLVPGYAAARIDLPTFTVVPADETALAAARPPVDTTAMGAGPAPRAAAPAPARARRY